MSRILLDECIPSEQFLELFHREAGIAIDTSHRKSIYGVVTRNSDHSNSIRHDDMFALADNAKAGFLQSVDCIKVIDARNFRHR